LAEIGLNCRLQPRWRSRSERCTSSKHGYSESWGRTSDAKETLVRSISLTSCEVVDEKTHDRNVCCSLPPCLLPQEPCHGTDTGCGAGGRGRHRRLRPRPQPLAGPRGLSWFHTQDGVRCGGAFGFHLGGTTGDPARSGRH